MTVNEEAAHRGHISPEPLADDRRSVDWRDTPGRTDPMVSRLSALVGGPVGRHAMLGRTRFFTPLRAMLLLAVVFLALGWFGKAACIQQAPLGPDGALGLDWSNNRQYVAMCYSDIVPLYGAERLNEGAFPYATSWEEPGTDGQTQTRYMEYPVVAGLYQYVSMRVAKAWDSVSWLPGGLQVAIYFNVVALVLAFAWLATVWATAMSAGRRVWDAALVAASPLVMVHAFTNFDALATAFAAGGLLAWARRRPVLAGVLLGIGAATKLYPLLLLGPLLVLCLRTGKMRAFFRTLGAAVGTWLAVNLPIMLLYPQGWYEFFRLNSDRGADPDSIYNALRSFVGWPDWSPSTLNVVSLLLFATACAAIGWLALTAPRRPRLAQLCFLLVAAFLFTNKVWSPQYSLWLVPLAVLAIPHRRVLLAWMTVDAFVWVPRMFYYLGPDNKGVPEQWFTATVVIRDIAVLALCAVVLWQIRRPVDDPVRYGFIDDPVGGVLDQAPDAHPRRLPGWLKPAHQRAAPKASRPVSFDSVSLHRRSAEAPRSS
ncbi:glycosyltransferase family 87 protein [Rhodococcus artemisiae]|uniref:Glycosyltransferase family 87 protein n=1 Tax=Rhodococcus artemisiae TaxID=714159 RepID=A0ABU7LFA3_9NOCA|nr:glycosyltransferase family 87 protein [Rhodococcus artemisiae]MEE2060236.1 glycosyltransferase family 87 protein [Rhodococcus artemisiae]